MSRRWWFRWVLPSAWLVTALLSILATPAGALYFFLDSDGDGKHTDADVVNPRGTTRVTLWLAAGESKSCLYGSPEDVAAYSVVVYARGGTVTWGQFAPTSPANGAGLPYETDDSTYFIAGQDISNGGAPHAAPIGTFTVNVRRGRPAIEITHNSPLDGKKATWIATTSWKAEVWACSYGLRYGGEPNRAPSLVPLADYPIRAATSERMTAGAADRDGDPLTFRVREGPHYVSVTTLNPGHGDAEGEIRVAPDSCDSGPATFILEVSDGFASACDTATYTVIPISKPIPRTPMQAPLGGHAVQDSTSTSSPWPIGEWEWHMGGASWKRDHADRPSERGYRRRLIFCPSGEIDMFDIGTNRVLRARRGTYRYQELVDDQRSRERGAKLTISNWIGESFPYSGADDSASFQVSGSGSPYLGLYPWGVTDQSTDWYVRVPPMVKNGSPVDTERIVEPIDVPSVRPDRGGTHVSLSPAMQGALRKCDPAFQLWSDADSRELESSSSDAPKIRGPTAIAGDFDGDLLPDVAVLGRSGADQVVIAILSGHGNIGAVEVAWRKFRRGQGSSQSRGDPQSVIPIYLELAPRGSFNPFCWVKRRNALPVDGVGIVEVGGARFDYVLDQGNFVFFAPVP